MKYVSYKKKRAQSRLKPIIYENKTADLCCQGNIMAQTNGNRVHASLLYPNIPFEIMLQSRTTITKFGLFCFPVTMSLFFSRVRTLIKIRTHLLNCPRPLISYLETIAKYWARTFGNKIVPNYLLIDSQVINWRVNSRPACRSRSGQTWVNMDDK